MGDDVHKIPRLERALAMLETRVAELERQLGPPPPTNNPPPRVFTLWSSSGSGCTVRGQTACIVCGFGIVRHTFRRGDFECPVEVQE